MRLRLTFLDSGGRTRFKAWALPLVVSAIVLPITAAFLLAGASAGFAMTALVAATILFIAARSRPYRAMEVAESGGERRVLVLSGREPGTEDTARIAELARGAADVRLLVPTPSTRVSRLFSDEDRARAHARDLLARSAGSLTAAGLAVSGSVGDADPAQAVEDELRSFAATEVLVLPGAEWEREVEDLRARLALPLTTVGG